MQGNDDTPDIKNVLNANVIFKDNLGSQSWNKAEGRELPQGYDFMNPNVSNVIIDKSQAAQMGNQYGANVLLPSVMAHELSHLSRGLSQGEERSIMALDNNSSDKKLYNQNIKDYTRGGAKYDPETLKVLNFSDYLRANAVHGNASHDAAPDEIKADLDALRYQMWKKGIYDTSKRSMTLDDYKKAISDKDIKSSLELKRLSDRFKPEDLIKLNNTIASTKTKSTNQA